MNTNINMVIKKINITSIISPTILFNVRWNILSVLFLQGGNFLVSIIIARLIGKYAFGIYGAIVSTAIIIIGIAGAGLNISATKFVAEANFYAKERIGGIIAACKIIALLSGGIYCGLLFCFSDLIGEYILNNHDYGVYLLYSIPYIFFYVMNLYQTGILQGGLKFKNIALLNGVYTIINIILTCLLGSIWGIKGVLLALGIASILNWYLYNRDVGTYLTEIGIHLNFKQIKNEYFLLKSFFLPAIFSGLLGSIGPWFANMFLIHASNGYNEMALFTAVNSYKTFITIIPALFARVYSPLICKSRLENQLQFKNYVKELISVSTLISCMISIIIIFTYPYLLNLFGHEFKSSILLIIVLCLVGILETIVACFYQILYSYGLMKYQFVISLLWTLTLVISAWAFTKEYGALGMVMAYFLATISSVLFYILLYLRHRYVSINSDTSL